MSRRSRFHKEKTLTLARGSKRKLRALCARDRAGMALLVFIAALLMVAVLVRLRL